MEKHEMKFPDCFPEHFIEKILPQGLPDLETEVFRVCTNGIINKESFSSTFEEIISGRKPKPPNWEKKKELPETYSVSCSDKRKDIINVLKCLVGYHPEAFLMQGIASSELGPLQRTADRNPKYSNKSHFDWWLYADSDPSPQFRKADETQNIESALSKESCGQQK